MKRAITTLIIDDEPLARRRILKLLQKDADVNFIGECRNGVEAVEVIREQQPELIFLDVQMPDLDGFGVLAELQETPLPFIIFVTAYDQYAIKAFEVHALDYLLKPFDDERFETALTHAKTSIRRRTVETFSQRMIEMLHTHRPNEDARREANSETPSLPERVVIKSGGRVYFLKTTEIDWIEAAGVYAKLHTGEKSHLLRETMNNLEARLSPEQFIRIHRSSIVNIDAIKELYPHDHGEYIVVLKDGTELRCSRGFRERLQAALGGF